MATVLHATPRMHALPDSDAPDVPTVGTIKRALHDLTRSAAAPGDDDGGAALREANDLLRQYARRHGIDPDEALRRSLAAVKLLRDRLASG